MGETIISIDVSDMMDALRATAALPGRVEGGLRLGVMEAGDVLQRETQERTPTAEGLLRSTILVSAMEPAGPAVLRVGSPQSYAVPVELGTKPHMPPVQPIQYWVARKLGIKDEKKAKAVAWAIAKKIARHGTKGAHMFARAAEENAGQVKAIVERHIRAALAALAQEGG